MDEFNNHIARFVSLGALVLVILSGCSLDSKPTLADPRAHTICSQVVDQRCAERAAAAVVHAVAWIPVTKAQGRANLIWLTSRSGFVIEKLAVGSVEVSIESPKIPLSSRTRPSSLTWRGGSGSLRWDKNPGVQMMTLNWRRDGVNIKMTMLDDQLDPMVARKIANMVRYAP